MSGHGGAAAGRGGRSVAALVGLLVAVTIGVSVGGPAIGRGVLHASDTLLMQAPWRHDAPHAFRPANPAVSDTVDATVPVRAEWSRRVRDGDLPLWTDLQAGGAPLAAVPNASAFSPLSVLWYVLPLWLAPAATKLLEMAIAALFTFLFVRRLGLGRLPGGLAALAFVNSGFQVVWTNWPQSHVGALVPALFWAVDRAVVRRRAADVVPVALVSAAMWFEGFPAVALWAHAAVAVYALVRAVPAARRRGERRAGAREPEGEGRRRTVAAVTRPVVLAATGLVLGVAVAAVQLVPFVERLGQLDLAYREEKILGALPWEAAVTLLVPDAFGNPVDRVFYGARNYVELNAFAGAAVLVLLVVGLVLGQRSRVAAGPRGFLLAATVVCVWLMFVGGPLLDAFHAIPVIGANSIGRLRSVLGFLIAVQAAIGLDALCSPRTGPAATRRTAAALLAAGAVGAVFVRAAWRIAEDAGRLDYLEGRLVLPLAATVVAVTLVIVAGSSPRASVRRGLAAALLVLVAVEGAVFARGFLPRIDREHFYPVTATHRFLADELGHDRLAADGFTMVPGSTVVYGLRSVTSHTLTPAPYADLLAAVDPTVFDRNRTYPVFSPRPELPSSPVLDRLAARFFVADPATPVSGSAEAVTSAVGTRRIVAGEQLAVDVPAGPLRAVRLDLREPIAPDTVTYVDVDVVDRAGATLAAGRRRVLPRTRPGPFDVALAGLEDGVEAGAGDGAAGPVTVRVSVVAAAGGVDVGVAEDGAPAVTLVRPVADGLRIAATDGATVYRRERALPRLRWASRAVVEADPAARVALLADGALPDDAVLLSVPSPSVATDAPRTPAEIAVVEDSGDVVDLVVTSQTDGFVVVADTLQDGWVAHVDDRPVELLDADHAFVAVAVPAGRHEVRLAYRPPGWGAGVAVSGVAVALLGAALVLDRRRGGTGGDAAAVVDGRRPASEPHRLPGAPV